MGYRRHERIVRREEAEQGPLAGLEELGASSATLFDRFAAVDLADHFPSTTSGRFDECLDFEPPPRLA